MKKKKETLSSNNRLCEDDFQKCCAFCENASDLSGTNYVLCEKKGVVALKFVCRKFSFDPLKINPQTQGQDDPDEEAQENKE